MSSPSQGGPQGSDSAQAVSQLRAPLQQLMHSSHCVQHLGFGLILPSSLESSRKKVTIQVLDTGCLCFQPHASNPKTYKAPLPAWFLEKGFQHPSSADASVSHMTNLCHPQPCPGWHSSWQPLPSLISRNARPSQLPEHCLDVTGSCVTHSHPRQQEAEREVPPSPTFLCSGTF